MGSGAWGKNAAAYRDAAENKIAISPRLKWALFLYQLRMAGYPFGKDELSLEEWLDLGEVTSALS
ncbi:hypothetical protein CCP3SC15_330020 [Gammaproteobacteria bacterium]